MERGKGILGGGWTPSEAGRLALLGGASPALLLPRAPVLEPLMEDSAWHF